jgi:hypothetical protein
MTALLLLVASLQDATVDAEAGFQGSIFPGSWGRVVATVSYEGENLEAELRITVRCYASQTVVYRRPLQLLRKARMRLGTDVYFSGQEYAIDVELIHPKRSVRPANLTLRVLRDEVPRLLVVGSAPQVLTDAMAKQPPMALVRLAPELLPPTPLSLLGVDAILIPEPIELDAQQEDALLAWVRQGGALIFGAGRSTLLRQSPFWRALCPIASPEIASISVSLKDAEGSLSLVRGSSVKGSGGFLVAGSPAVIRYAEGRGEIVFVPLLLAQEGLSKALSAPALLAELLRLPPPPVEEPLRPGQRYRARPAWVDPKQKAVYFQEISDALPRLLGKSFTVSLLPLGVGLGLGVLYLAALGPFGRQRRVARRGRLALALVILGFAGVFILWSRAITPGKSRASIITLHDAQRIRSYAAFRPARGGEFELEGPGAITPLPASATFGTTKSEAMPTVTLPSTVRLSAAPMASKFLLVSRASESADGSVTAVWDSAERSRIRIQSSLPVPLNECWVVSKETVWPIAGIPAGSSSTVLLKEGKPFELWAPTLLLPGVEPGVRWWSTPSTWDRLAPSRWGLAMIFHEALHRTWTLDGSRHLLVERGVDLSPALDRGEVVLVGSFDRNLSGLRIQPSLDPETYGWTRVRVGEAPR